MTDEHTIKSMRAAAIAMLAGYKCKAEGSNDPLNEYKAAFEENFDEILALAQPDLTGWAHYKGKMFYDIYLLMREEEGTITEADRTRRGLKAHEFADSVAYHEHCIRVSKHEPNDGPPKVCSSCGQEKPANKFKKRGGAKCNACRSKEYRERKDAA